MRPGGLTALAIFNFVFGGLGLLFSLINLLVADKVLEAMTAMATMLGKSPPSASAYYLILVLGIVRQGMLIMSGVGYLGLRKFIGRTVGNTYAALALFGIILEATLLPGITTVLGLMDFVYPMITLFLLNVIFRKDFVR
jgi:hypothetical protein